MQPGPLLSHVGGHRVPAAPPPDPSGNPLARQGGLVCCVAFYSVSKPELYKRLAGYAALACFPVE